MNKLLNVLLSLLLSVTGLNILQGQSNINPKSYKERGNIRLMFYNVENLFDTLSNDTYRDDEFLPESERKWNTWKYRKKIDHLFKVIAATGELSPPEIMGFAEIENARVLHDLLFNTPLNKFTYEIVHTDSPDKRGIDVGLIYRSDKISCLEYSFIPILFPWAPDIKTRDILYFKGTVENDTIHIFINHWPSRSGGQKKTEPGRVFVAKRLKQKSDSILLINRYARIIIMGDFNDEPENKSISASLGAIMNSNTPDPGKLYNLSLELKNKCNCGTYRYGAHWNMFDQVIVSGSLLINSQHLSTCNSCLKIAYFDFLLEDDDKYGGKKPFRTYNGPSYHGGFSDHLPVYLDLFF